MNGNGKGWIFVALGLGAAAWYYFSSAGAAGGSAGNTSGDTSGGSSSGADPSADSSSVEGIVNTLGIALGIKVPKGIRDNDPGNLRYSPSIPWTGLTGQDGGFDVFDNPEHGVRALGHQLETYANRGINTVSAIISTFAPSDENDTAAYITDVADRIGVDPNTPFDVNGALPALVEAIITHENGEQPYDQGQIAQWVYEA